jgi:hypothetical protein
LLLGFSHVSQKNVGDLREPVTDLRASNEKDFEEVVVSLSCHYPSGLEVLSITVQLLQPPDPFSERQPALYIVC